MKEKRGKKQQHKKRTFQAERKKQQGGINTTDLTVGRKGNLVLENSREYIWICSVRSTRGCPQKLRRKSFAAA